MKPRKITERELIRTRILTASEWLKDHEKTGSPDVVAVQKKVMLLNPEASTVADLAAVGDRGCFVHCDGCGKWVTNAIEVGAEPDWESATATLCHPCVMEAAALCN